MRLAISAIQTSRSRHRGIRRRIGARHLEERSPQQAAEGDGGRRPIATPVPTMRGGVAQHHQPHVGGASAERHAQAELAGPLGHRIGHHAVDAGCWPAASPPLRTRPAAACRAEGGARSRRASARRWSPRRPAWPDPPRRRRAVTAGTSAIGCPAVRRTNDHPRAQIDDTARRTSGPAAREGRRRSARSTSASGRSACRRPCRRSGAAARWGRNRGAGIRQRDLRSERSDAPTCR